MKKILIGLILLIFCFAFGSAFADSVWDPENSTSPYSTDKTYKLGDVITVIISESPTAISQAGTDTAAKDNLALSLNHTIDRLASVVGKNTSLTGKGENKYKGSGATSRSSKVQAVVSCRVIKILENGNLKIAGTHQISVNDEEQSIQIVGIIRSKDVSIDNTISSSKVAQSQVSVKGKGIVQEAEQPGFIVRFLNWLF